MFGFARRGLKKPFIRPYSEKTDKDLAILRRFIEVYCVKVHGSRPHALCGDCAGLYEYARHMREHCPYEPKPKCKDCPTHCYRPEMRRKIRHVMRYSGMYFVKRGRLDWLIRYFF